MNRRILVIIVVIIIIIAGIVGTLLKSKGKSTNATNSTTPYILDGENDANENTIVLPIDSKNTNKNKENVTIEVLTNTITKESANILITDNNEEKYGWGRNFKVQKKLNDIWEDLKWIREDLAFTDLGYKLDKNNQLKMKINYGDYYGELDKGIYRIVKIVYDGKYIDLYSNEFEIK